jgi:DNA ligase (NAD+)
MPDIGQKVAELLIEAGLGDIDSLQALADSGDTAPLRGIHGIGERTAATLIAELRRPDLRARIARLRKAGVQMQESPRGKAPGIPQSFAGQTWCVTGSFESFAPREQAMEEVERRGGRVTSSVSTKTTHLLAGSAAGSKLEKARELGVRIVDEKEFLAMLGAP